MPPSALGPYLTALHDDYVERVNAAVAEDREDLVRSLADAYADEALAAKVSAGDDV